MKWKYGPTVLFLALPLMSLLCAQSQEKKIVAEIGQIKIDWAELEKAARAELVKLDEQRHGVLEKHLQNLIAQELIRLEAEERGVDSSTLLEQQVQSKVTEPSQAEIDRLFELNKSRLNGSDEQKIAQIRQYLQQQQGQALYKAMIERLETKFNVVSHLEAFRISVEMDGFPSVGPADAAVTIVEFSDFECPYCSRFTQTIKDIRRDYGDRVRLVFRQFPLTSIHPNAIRAAQASLCAADQEKFWELHDRMFEDQQLSLEAIRSKAELIGLDMELFEECLSSEKHAAQVQVDMDAGRSVGVNGTPAIFINGRPLHGAASYEQVAEIIEEELKSP